MKKAMQRIEAPWEQMTLSERVCFLIEARCSPTEVEWVTSVPAPEVERLQVELRERQTRPAATGTDNTDSRTLK